MTSVRHERLAGGTAYAGRGPQWLLLLDGAVRLEVAGAAHDLAAGDAVLVAAGRETAVTASVDSRLAVSDLALAVPLHPLPAVTVVRGFAARHAGIAALVRLCPMAVRCGPPLMTASYADLVGSAMTASWLEGREPAGTAGPGTDGDPVVRIVLAALAERPGDCWTVERMAALVHLSRSALGERFRRVLRRSPAEALRDARMQEARALLRDGDRTVEQVARAVGYGSAAAFSRAFAADHGMPPQTWRSRSGAHGPQRGEHQAGERGGRGPQHQRRHDTPRVDERAS